MRGETQPPEGDEHQKPSPAQCGDLLTGAGGGQRKHRSGAVMAWGDAEACKGEPTLEPDPRMRRIPAAEKRAKGFAGGGNGVYRGLGRE